MEILNEGHRKWPELNYENWKETCQTLHRWMQIVGKVRLTKSPWINHSWNATFYVTEQGLTTSVIHDKDFSFSITFDFLEHLLRVSRSDGTAIAVALVAEPVAMFHKKCLGALGSLGIEAIIFGQPNELVDATPFTKDQVHCSYDPQYAQRFWRALLETDRVMKIFRSRFLGKVSPVQFFWGSFDLAITRFSGRRAPEHPGGVPHLPDLVAKEAYSHEVSSCGFWPGNERVPYPAFYSYAYPKPEGFENAKVRPSGAFFHEGVREFILPYETVRSATNPDALLLEFFQSTYEIAANLGQWDRPLLEESPYLQKLQSGKDLQKAA